MTAPPSFPPSRGSDPVGPSATSRPGRSNQPRSDISRRPRTDADPTTRPTTRWTAARMPAAHRAPAVVVALAASAACLALWAVFVGTPTGRLVDEAAWEGALTGQNELWTIAGPVLDLISGPFIIGVLLATMLLAVLRRRVLLAVQVAIVVGGANLTTQVLKRIVLDRPDLGLGDTMRNTLPSGHTTAAASVAVALVLVVPRRLRPIAAVLGAVYTAATGVSTLVGRWHRPSDAAAAVLVVLAWAGVASAVGSRVVVARRLQESRQSVVVAGLLLLAALGSGVGAAVALQRSVAAFGEGGEDLTTRAELLTAYGGGALGVTAVVCAAFAVLLMMLRSVESGPAETGRGA